VEGVVVFLLLQGGERVHLHPPRQPVVYRVPDTTTASCYIDKQNRVDIQRRGSILAWIVILSVYGAHTIAEIKLLISSFLL
jgi:hypothetical protein